MIKLTINNHEVEVETGSTILDAARKLGIDVPTLCFRDGCEPSISCMVCVVDMHGRLVPSCATVATEGMEIRTETDEVHEARRAALELLLSDHVGDCIAPCHRTCPAGMNIPLMLRQIVADELQDAIITVKQDIALPAVLGRICPAPCENACRRGSYDDPVSICILKRYVADVDLMSESPYLPSCKDANGKRVAIVGAGPTGLAAAYYLLQEGCECMLFDDHNKPGGMLQYGVPEDRLPREVLDAELGVIEKLGAKFQLKTKIGEHLSVPELRRDYDAILIATGELEEEDAGKFGIQFSARGIQMDRNTLQTDLKGVFAAGTATGRKSKMAVRSVADGKAAAASITQYLSGLPVVGSHKPFTVSIGKLAEGEIDRFLGSEGAGEQGSRGAGERGSEEAGERGSEEAGNSASSIQHPVSSIQSEAARCLHCDCRAASNCKLRDYSEAYGANPNRYRSERKLFEQYPHEIEASDEPYVIYEPGKCIKCGICIQITSEAKEALGLTFIGRGFDVQVGVPFNRSIADGLRKVADQCVVACPTGALALHS